MSIKLKVILLFYFFTFFAYIINNYHQEKIYITLTSWKGRISFIHKNLELLLNNAIKPNKVILNLSIEEFPKKYLELPKTILSLLKKYNNFEIFWVKINNNVFKKLIPTLNRFKKDLIITVDDDILYPNDFIENMLKCYYQLGGKNPVSFGTRTSDWNIKGKIIHSHYGGGSIVKYKYFNNKINEIYKNTTIDRINKGIKCPDDLLYTYAALLNGYRYIRCKNYSIKLNIHIPYNKTKSFSENNSKNMKKLLEEYHNIIERFIKNKYNITINNLIEKSF